jgi:hypothetical protein
VHFGSRRRDLELLTIFWLEKLGLRGHVTVTHLHRLAELGHGQASQPRGRSGPQAARVTALRP